VQLQHAPLGSIPASDSEAVIKKNEHKRPDIKNILSIYLIPLKTF
jgi:hypothetical protein